MHDAPSPPSLRLFQDPTLCGHCHHQNQQGARYCEHCGMLLPAKVDVLPVAAPSPSHKDRQDATGSRWFALGKLFSAHGRVGRKDYWIVQIGGSVLFFILAGGALAALDVLGLNDTDDRGARNRQIGRLGSATTGGSDTWEWLAFGGPFVLFALIVLFASIKRLHDFGDPGWWMLIGWIPPVGFIMFLWFSFARGQKGLNKYGAVNSGSPFPFLHRRASRGSLPVDVAEHHRRGVSRTAIAIGAVALLGVAILVF